MYCNIYNMCITIYIYYLVLYITMLRAQHDPCFDRTFGHCLHGCHFKMMEVTEVFVYNRKVDR